MIDYQKLKEDYKKSKEDYKKLKQDMIYIIYIWIHELNRKLNMKIGLKECYYQDQDKKFSIIFYLIRN